MYETFYGLREKPFQITPDPEYLYRSPKHEAALTYLEYGVSENTGFILLTGEVGSGKTTLVQYMMGQLPHRTEAAMVFNTNVTPPELLAFILEGFGAPRAQGDRVALLRALAGFLVDRFVHRKHVVLILDEAQNLSEAALEEVRMLSNLRKDGQPLLQIILVGQPELAAKLRKPALRQFAQRIAASYHLTGLNRQETGSYIAFRLKQAGARADLFEPAAVDLIHELSGGIPRAINLTCQAALVYGFAEGAVSIGVDIIRQVREDHMSPAIDQAPEPAESAGTDGGANGNGIKHGIDAIGLELRELKKSMHLQFQALQQKRLESFEAGVGRLQRLLQEERSRNAELSRTAAELARQNKALKALGLRLKEELKRRPAG
jgi:general secretion pathway protein A